MGAAAARRVAVDRRGPTANARGSSRALVVFGLVVALALPGCFGSDDDNGSSSSADGSGDTTQQRDANDEGGAGGGASSSEGAGTLRSGASTGIEPAATRAELIRRADPVCRAAQARIQRTSKELNTLLRRVARKRVSRREYYQRSAGLTERGQQVVEDTLATLRALGRPPERRAALDRYLTASERHAAVTGEIANALRGRRLRQVAQLNRRWIGLTQTAHAAARAYGFKVCGGN